MTIPDSGGGVNEAGMAEAGGVPVSPRRRRQLLALLILLAAAALAMAWWRRHDASGGVPAVTRLLYVRCPTADGLQAGDRVMAGAAAVGMVTDVKLLADGVFITCRFEELPRLILPVRAAIRAGAGTERMLVLTGSAGDGELLQARDMLVGESEIELPGELAPLRLP